MDVFSQLCRLRQERTPLVLCTVVRTSGSTPRKSSARMLVTHGGLACGTVGGGRVEREVIEAAQLLLERAGQPELRRYHLTHGLGMCCGGEMEVFLEPIIPAPRLVVCGGGHIAAALVPVAHSIGFGPVVVEDLPELGSPARFPLAERIIDSFDPADWDGIDLDDGQTYVVIVTRDHRQDQELLEALLGRRLRYLGLIGSRRKVAVFKRRLLHKGLPEASLAHLHAPIGLSIGAQTPEEIAVAIAAELIQVRAAGRAPRAQGAGDDVGHDHDVDPDTGRDP